MSIFTNPYPVDYPVEKAMSQTFYIPIDDLVSLCQCSEVHYWGIGEDEYQCVCGRTYRKAPGFTVGSLLSEAATVRKESTATRSPE